MRVDYDKRHLFKPYFPDKATPVAGRITAHTSLPDFRLLFSGFYLTSYLCLNMKKIVRLLFVVIAGVSIVSCSTSKHPARKSPPKYGKQTVSRLSKQFGIRLVPQDNIRLYDACSSWIGVKYRYGGKTKNGVDCSGFVQAIYKQVYGISLERTAAGMMRRNCTPVGRNRLREGDLVFFKTSRGAKNKPPDHVGIYLKNGRFIHAGSTTGVAVSRLSETYYVRAWLGGGRVKRLR
jgi:lipoprotein Spr